MTLTTPKGKREVNEVEDQGGRGVNVAATSRKRPMVATQMRMR